MGLTTKIGVCLEAFGRPFRSALAQAAKLGVGGVQCDAVGDLSPRRLSASGRREIRHLLRSQNLELAGLVCPLRRGLDVAEDLEPRLARVREAMTLSFELGARIVVVDAGAVPERDDDPRLIPLIEALTALGPFGDRTGTTVALQTGPDAGLRLAEFLTRFDSGALGVAANPANWFLHGFDPAAELAALGGKIVLVHAADAVRGRSNRMGGLAPLGHGDLDWLQLAGTLAALDYRGWIVVERGGVTAETDVANGVSFLRRLLG